MSLTVSKRVWEHSQQRGSALVLMLALADWANRQSVAWPKTKTLAEQARLGVRQVQVLVAELEEAGEIEVRRNVAGGREANFYLVKAGDGSVTWPKTIARERVHSNAQRVNPDSQRVNHSSQTGESGFAPYKESEPSIEPSIDSSSKNLLAEVPAELTGFHSELKDTPGYRPSEGLFRKVLANYAGLDLEEEAIGMASWFESPNPQFKGRTPRDAGRQCNSLFILGWLRRSSKRTSEPEPTKGQGNGSSGYSQRCHI